MKRNAARPIHRQGFFASTNGSSRVPGELMLHPVALIAVATLALNDHVFKAAYGTWLTGKLSDCAGLIFFPLFLISVWEIACSLRSRTFHFGLVALRLSLVWTALLFIGINVSAGAASLYTAFMTQLWGCLGAAGAQATYVTDPTDLLALPFLVVPYVLGRKQLARDAALR